MNWYTSELITESRQREVERQAELRRRTPVCRKGIRFWLLATMRSWIIGVTR
jgi:hypothetical protein